MNFSNTNQTQLLEPAKGWRTSKICILILLGFLITSFNLMVILMYLKTRVYVRKIADLLLFNQAIVDMYHGVVFVPIQLLVMYQDEFTLKFAGVFIGFAFLLESSVYLIISKDRCFSISCPLLHRRVMKIKIVRYELCFVWLSSLLLTLLPFSWWHKEPFIYPETGLKLYKIYMLVILTVVKINFFLTVLLTCVTFYKIYRQHRVRRSYTAMNVGKKLMGGKKSSDYFKPSSWRRRSNRSKQCRSSQDTRKICSAAQRNESKHIRILACMVTFYCLTFLPAIVQTFLDLFKVPYPRAIMTDVFLYIYLLSSAINPVITLKFKFADKIKSFCGKVKETRLHTEGVSVKFTEDFSMQERLTKT